jgi:hypothetical protein
MSRPRCPLGAAHSPCARRRLQVRASDGAIGQTRIGGPDDPGGRLRVGDGGRTRIRGVSPGRAGPLRRPGRPGPRLEKALPHARRPVCQPLRVPQSSESSSGRAPGTARAGRVVIRVLRVHSRPELGPQLEPPGSSTGTGSQRQMATVVCRASLLPLVRVGSRCQGPASLSGVCAAARVAPPPPSESRPGRARPGSVLCRGLGGSERGRPGDGEVTGRAGGPFRVPPVALSYPRRGPSGSPIPAGGPLRAPPGALSEPRRGPLVLGPVLSRGPVILRK